MSSPAAVVFDLDGVLLDSEQVWSAARHELVESRGGEWSAGADRDMLGMSSTEWSEYMHERLRVPLEPAAISRAVAELVEARYRRRLPLVPGADGALRRIASCWPLGLASSSNGRTIELALELAGWSGLFAATVSSEQVARGKPAPDVYTEAVRQLRVSPRECVAVEDSDAGVRSALAAGLGVVAIPNRAFPPQSATLARAEVVLEAIAALDPPAVMAATGGAG